MQSDVVIIGAGLAGLVAANELVARGKTVTILDQEGRQNLGGQAFWSLGGLLMIDTPEQRRLKVYEDLIYSNIEGFISSGFPVLRSLYEDVAWHGLVRDFIEGHRCHTPYFLEISQEFLKFLMEDFTLRAVDPPFIAELSHYEWVELALDTAEDEIPDQVAVTDLLTSIPQLSPLAWSLVYRYPVQRIGADCRP